MSAEGGTSHEARTVIALVHDVARWRAQARSALEGALATHGVVVLEGVSGRDAIALRFGSPTPDLLLVEHTMPVMGGLDALEAIRIREHAEGLPAMPVIVTAGWTDANGIARAGCLGAIDTVIRPFRDGDLLPAVRAALGIVEPPGSPVVAAVIDDEMPKQMVMQRIVGRVLGVDFRLVATGANGADAVRLHFRQPYPPFMFINGLMPDIDGPVAIAAIRRHEKRASLPRMPIAILSAEQW